jgi:hypothetical protein
MINPIHFRFVHWKIVFRFPLLNFHLPHLHLKRNYFEINNGQCHRGKLLQLEIPIYSTQLLLITTYTAVLEKKFGGSLTLLFNTIYS